MAYNIDDDENRIQDLKDEIDELKIQSFSPEVVGRNESTRNTGIETGDSAALNPYPQRIPIRDFGTLGLLTIAIDLLRVDAHVAKMTLNGDSDFAFINPPSTTKMTWFILDVTIDGTGGYTINLLNNILPAGITIDNTANARTVIRFTTTDGGVTYYAENLTTGGGGGGTSFIGFMADADLDMNTFDIKAGGAGKGVTDIGKLDFVDNLATPASPLSIYSDGTDLFANTGGGVKNLSDIGSGGGSPLTTKGDLFGFNTIDAKIPVGADGQVLTANSSAPLGVSWQSAGSSFSGNLSDLVIDADKSWNDKNITDLLSIGSSAASLPGSGFIRIGTGEEIRMRNPGNDDDLIITSGNDALSNEAIIFKVASATILTISEFNVDVNDHHIINTGNIEVGSGSHDIGTTSNPYNQIFADFFIPDDATIITGRYGLAKTGNTLYVNFDNTNPDAGFGIYEEGLQRFLFRRTGNSPFTNELFIGEDPFVSGETYKITMGANSNSSGIIRFTEGVGNDVIIDRAGGGTDQGVQIRVNGISLARFLSNEIKIFQPLNADSQDFQNVKNIFSDDTGGKIGDLVTGPIPGGFDYYVKDKIFWDTDSNTNIQFASTGIHIASDDSFTASSNDGQIFTTVNNATGFDFFPNNSLAVTIRDNSVVLQSGVLLSLQDDILFGNGFRIQDTDASTTTLAIPDNDVLRFTDNGTEVGKYDADDNNWVFNPPNDVQLSPDVDVDLTPGGNIIMNPTGDINVFEDLNMQGSNTLDSGVALSSVPVGSPIGAWQIKIQGVVRKINIYAV